MLRYHFDWQDNGGYADIEAENEAKISDRNKNRAEVTNVQVDSSKTMIYR